MRYDHQFDAFYNHDSQILILGSFPSVKSREVNFYYGHPQNRFWKMLQGVFHEEIKNDIEAKKAFCTRHKIALWDVLQSCEIQGSSDASIKNAEYTDIASLIQQTHIQLILINGKTAYKHYLKNPQVDIPVVCLPSTSAANAACSLEKLINEWQEHLFIL